VREKTRRTGSYLDDPNWTYQPCEYGTYQTGNGYGYGMYLPYRSYGHNAYRPYRLYGYYPQYRCAYHY
jgi:hypothetical protein